ncbi:hypothetical protein A3I53_03100 [Candidatus Curtissbacteria bacterium RIFCSPLOWO2_02_FULL_40_13b]|nr:MAG: hypothetical protein A3I53_03100 [Candidatus Curtissbacteria bacterium RIFCSPLOWO2_02_FULL_40_13b]
MNHEEDPRLMADPGSASYKGRRLGTIADPSNPDRWHGSYGQRPVRIIPPSEEDPQPSEMVAIGPQEPTEIAVQPPLFQRLTGVFKIRRPEASKP